MVHVLEEYTWQKREKSAKAALSYISNIADKLPNKLRIHTKPKEEFKLLVKNCVPYDSYGMEMALRTFERKKFKCRMSRYKKLRSGNYGYIFTFART